MASSFRVNYWVITFKSAAWVRALLCAFLHRHPSLVVRTTSAHHQHSLETSQPFLAGTVAKLIRFLSSLQRWLRWSSIWTFYAARSDWHTLLCTLCVLYSSQTNAINCTHLLVCCFFSPDSLNLITIADHSIIEQVFLILFLNVVVLPRT